MSCAAPAFDVGSAIRAAAGAVSLSLSDRQAEQLVAYVDLLERWNATYNLTAVREPDRIVTLHLADCLAAIAPLRREIERSPSASILDVGSGAGLPGIVIGVMNPEWRVTCVDAVGKKAAFIRQASANLCLTKVGAVHARVESIDEQHDVIVSRAFSSLLHLVSATDRALADGGSWMAMKGRVPDDELAALNVSKWTFHVEQLEVPNLEAERCLVWIGRNDAANQ